MLAIIEKVEHGYIARFERHLQHPVEAVWTWLTENDKLVQWFPELQVGELREGGFIKFDMQDGTFEELEITEFTMNSVLEFTWWGNRIRFELDQEMDSCRLVLEQKMETITDHTPKDLAGWHVCLDVIKVLMDGKTIDSRKEEWKKWYEQYVQAIPEASE